MIIDQCKYCYCTREGFISEALQLVILMDGFASVYPIVYNLLGKILTNDYIAVHQFHQLIPVKILCYAISHYNPVATHHVPVTIHQ